MLVKTQYMNTSLQENQICDQLQRTMRSLLTSSPTSEKGHCDFTMERKMMLPSSSWTHIHNLYMIQLLLLLFYSPARTLGTTAYEIFTLCDCLATVQTIQQIPVPP